VLLVGIMLAVLSTSLIDGGRLVDALSGRIKLDEALLTDDQVEAAMVFGVLCAVPVMLALWFAPALVVFQDCGPAQAMKVSLRAALANWRPVAVYGLLLFFFGAVLPGMAIAIISLVAPPTIGPYVIALTVVPYVFLFVATQTISDYVAYRDIFHAGEASDPAESAVT